MKIRIVSSDLWLEAAWQPVMTMIRIEEEINEDDSSLKNNA
jgi:hypothetical protein